MLSIQNQITFTQKATEILLNQKVAHSKFGSGLITEIDHVLEMSNPTSVECLSIAAKIQFESNIKIFAINEMTLHLFTFDQEVEKQLTQFLNESQKILVKATSEAIRQERKEEAERKEKLKKEKLEELIQRKQKQELENIKDFKITHIENDPDANLFYTIGWLAKYTTRITASLPDYLENWFTSRYEIDDEDLKVIDSSERTPSGYSEKWGISMSLRFKPKTDNIPSLVDEVKAKKSNVVNNVDFVGDLIETYNFKFGKEQDLEEIKKSVPEEYLPAFEEGYTA